MNKEKQKIYPYLGHITESVGPKISTFEHTSPWKSANTAFYWSNFEYPLYHPHKDWEIIVVLDGSILHRLNGTEKIMTTAMGCIVGPKDRHALFFPNGIKNQYQSVYFIARDSYVKSLLGMYSPTLYDELSQTPQSLYFTLSKTALDRYESKLLEIQTFENQNTPYTELQCNIIFSNIFLKFLEQYQSETNILVPSTLKPFIQQLNNPLITSDQIKSAQQELPYSYSQITRLFKKYMGCTITQYLNNTKLQYAKELLSATTMTIMQITNELNFNSASHFHNLFKKHFNISPTEYRKLNRVL